MKSLGLLVLLASTSADASQCLSYGNVTFEGTLSMESVTTKGEKVSFYVVSPAQPLCIDANNDAPAVAGITKVEIEINRKGGWPLLNALLGQLVFCRGDLYLSQSGHPSTRWKERYHLPVTLRGMCHAAQPGAAADAPASLHSAGVPSATERRR